MRTAYQKILEQAEDSTVSNTSKGAFTLKGKKEEDIQPNYIYLRFDPKNEKQETRLKDKKRLLVIDYPFEYENSQDYHKTITLAEGEIPSYWASVPIETKLPNNIPYTILQEMYIPEKDPKYNGDADTTGKPTQKGSISDEIDLMNHVLEEAYAATGNADLLPVPENTQKKSDCKTCFLGINLRALWRPSGRLEIWDDNILVQQTRRVFSHYEYYDCPNTGGFEDPGFGGEELIDLQDTQCQRAVYRTENVGSPTTSGYMPLAGANVLVRDTWTLDSDITDNNGNFSFKRLRAKVKYIIQWDRYEFSIRDDTGVFQAEDAGPKLYDEPWNHKIKGGREEYRGKIFQAALDFYYGDIGGLSRPPRNGVWDKQMKITAKEKTGDSFHAPEQRTGGAVFGFFSGGGIIRAAILSAVTSTIRVAAYRRSSERVYGVTIHELAHAAHWDFDRDAYNDLVEDAWIEPFFGNNIDNPSANNAGARRTLESWATGVEVFLTNKRYRDLGNSSYDYRKIGNNVNQANYQNQPIDDGTRERYYTSIVWDMFDNINQASIFGSGFPVDNVSGFTLPELEENMKGVRSWNQFRDNVRSRNRQQNEIIELFANWD